MAVARNELVLEPREFRLLEGLKLNPRRTAPGRVRGERLTARKGISIEFADFRDYTDGDDLRHLDWNVLARLGLPIIKTYRDEEDLAAHLLVDTSLSMDFGSPTKFEHARRIACALGYVALCGRDALYSRALGQKFNRVHALRGRAGYRRLAVWANNLRPDDGETLSVALRRFANSGGPPGLAIILSDGLDPDAPNAIRAVGARGHEVLFVQALCPEEQDPDLEGDLRLLDSESADSVEITAHGHALREYRRRLDEHCAALASACRRVGGRYVLTSTTESLEAFIRGKARRDGWVAA